MTDCKGSILQLKEKQAIIMTDSCDFISIKRRPDMYIGQQVTFKKSDISRSKKLNLKAAALIASVFILALCSVFYMQVYNPDTAYAYIDVDINPSLEFSIDKDSQVISVTALNQDASDLIKALDLESISVKEAIIKVVEASKNLGFIAVGKENAVLISASVNKENPNVVDETKLDNLLKDLDEIDLGTIANQENTEELQSEIIKVSPEIRDSAVSNNISMGRYILFTKIKKDDNEITLEKAKTERVSDMLKEAKIKENDKDKSDKKDKDSEKSDKETSSSKNTENSSNNINNNSGNNTNNGNNKTNNKINNSKDPASNNSSSKNNASTSNNKNTQKEQIDKDVGKGSENTDSDDSNKVKNENKNNDKDSPPSDSTTEKDNTKNKNIEIIESSDQNANDQGSNSNKPEQSDKNENGNAGEVKNSDNQSDNSNSNSGKNGNKK